MKNKIDRMKTPAMHLSKRTVALILSVIMLVSSIATGSMLNTFAAYIKDNAAKTDVIADAASEGSAIAESAIPSEDADAPAQADDADEKPDLSGFEENEIVRRFKDDLAAAGAGIDLADTGYSLNEIKYLKLKKDGGSEVSYDINSGNVSVNISSSGTYNFDIVMNNGDRLTNTGSISNSISNWQLTTKTPTTNSCTLNVSTTGTYTFKFTISGDKVKMDVTFPSGGSTGSGTYVLTGDSAITGTSGWKNTITNNAANKLEYNSTTKLYAITKTVSNTSKSFNFRIVPNGTWDKTWGYDRANEVDNANIATWSEGSDNNINLTLSQPATIEIRLDDSKSDTSAVTVIVTPTTSTVTAAVTPAGSGTAKVGGQDSATVAYGGTVTVSATLGTDYLFSKWTSNNGKVSFASTTNASTTATVTGTDTVTANFVKKSYTVSKGTGTGFTITTPASNQSKQWGTSVSVTAKTSSDLYFIDYLYYLDNNTGDEKKLGTVSGSTSSPAAAADGAGTATSMTGSFTMPKNNVTVYAHTHKRQSYAVNYAVSTDSGSAGHGYVNAGMQYSSSSTNVKKTITSGDSVLQNEKVNIGARAESGYRFVGWYPNADGSGTVISTAKDVTVTVDAAKNYYAKFESLSAGTNKIKVYLPKSFADYKLWYWGAGLDAANDNIGSHGSDTTKVSAICTLVDLNGSEYYVKEFSPTKNPSTENFTFRIITTSNNDNTISAYGTYTFSAVTTKTSSAPTFDIYYPVKFVVTNPDLAGSATYAPLFGKKSTSTTFYHQPSDTSNNKTSVTTTGFTSDDTNDKTTLPSRSKTMPSSGSTTPVYTVTFVPKEYYKVNFSAGSGGTISATAGGTSIKSGTSVKEGTTVVYTAAASSGYDVAGWTKVKGQNFTNTSTTVKTISDLTGESEVRVYFSKSKGTETATTYIGYHVGTTGYDNPTGWTNFNKTFVRNGRVYGYISDLSLNKIVSFNAFDGLPANDTEKATKQYYHRNDTEDTTVWATTESFTGITPNGNRPENETVKWRNHYDHNGYIRFKVTDSAIKAVMIDLGPEDSSTAGKARPDLDHNTYKIIPIYNTDVNKVTVYAKDGTFRDDSEYDYTPSIADTVISNPTGGGVTNISSHTEFETAVAEKGKAIKVTTTIDTGAYNRDRFYVKGFSFNGVTPELLEPNDSGQYTCTYTIPADFEDDYLEITPIYFIKDSYLNEAANKTSAITFYIENYDEALQNTGWGNTLAVYPFYSTASSPVYSKANVFGGYPGLPVVNYGGRRYVQVPTTYKIAVDNESGSAYSEGTVATIKGITLSNYYWDKVHRDYCREVDTHLQTYDYDDFYTIYKETSDGYEANGKSTTKDKKAADQITFAFKYRTSYDNFTATNRYSVASNQIPNTITTTNYTNGREPLLDYHDRPINIFGRQLSNAEQANDPIYVVSNGYEYTRAGYYATTWTAYYNNNGTYTKIGTILPSALIVSSKDRMINNTLYPDGVSLGSDYPTMMQYDDANTQTVYDALKNSYADRPVMITYEKAILNSNTSGTGNYYHAKLGELSTRSDGRWFYSYMNEEINANLRIDYTNEYTGEETTKWTPDTYRSGTNTGSVTGATVHFTNTASDTDGSTYNLSDPALHDTHDYGQKIYSNFNHYYKFLATEGSGYIFQGWYMERDGISTAVNPDDIKNLAGQSQMTSNATFVARYVKNPAGHITIKHLMADGSTSTGTTYIGVEKSTDGANWENVSGSAGNIFERADSYSINDSDIMSYGSGYTLRVTLKTVVASDTNFDRFSASEADGDHSSEYFSTDVRTESTTSTTKFEIPVDDLFTLNAETGIPAQKAGYDTFTYYSHTTRKPELTISHNRDATSDALAEGEFYLKVEVLDASSNVLETYGGEHSKTIDNNVVVSDLAKGKDLTVPSNYFYGGNNGRKLRVTLLTDMSGFTQFDKFSILGENLGSHSTTTGQSVAITNQNSMRTKMAVITFPIADLFDGDTPRVTELPYLSRLILPEYKYQIRYTYPAYTDKTPVSYTAKDVFAQEDLNTYMSLTNNDLAFKTDDTKKSFACSKAPYEDNFQKILDWSKASFGNRSYDANTYTLTLEVTITEAEQQKLNVQFNLPYATDTAHGNNYEPVVSDGKIIKTDPHEILSNKKTYGRDWFVISGRRNKDIAGNDPVFVKAPLIIYDNSNQAYYFKYWSVKTEGTDNNPSRVYTRCYDYEFNLSIYQDCIITPEYDTTPFENRSMATPVPATYNDYGRFDPDVNRTYYKLEANGVSITFIENSRNQYNNDDGGNAVAKRHGAADRIYSDFLLTYDYDPKTILSKEYSQGGVKQAGMILQPVGYLNQVDGKYVVEDEDAYATKYPGLTPEQIKIKIQNDDFSGVIKSQFDVKELDNKNRMQYYYGIDNAAVKASGATADDDGIIRVGNMNNNHKLVFKAFAYIGDGNSTDKLTNVIVSPQPIYFTIYKDATIQPGYYMP